MTALRPGDVHRQVLRTVNQDGLPDAFTGFAMLVAALTTYLDRSTASNSAALAQYCRSWLYSACAA